MLSGYFLNMFITVMNSFANLRFIQKCLLLVYLSLILFFTHAALDVYVLTHGRTADIIANLAAAGFMVTIIYVVIDMLLYAVFDLWSERYYSDLTMSCNIFLVFLSMLGNRDYIYSPVINKHISDALRSSTRRVKCDASVFFGLIKFPSIHRSDDIKACQVLGRTIILVSLTAVETHSAERLKALIRIEYECGDTADFDKHIDTYF